MSALWLILSAVCVADAPPAARAPAGAPVLVSSTGQPCSTSCEPCCESTVLGRLRGKLRSCFRRDRCGCPAETCCPPAPCAPVVCAPCPPCPPCPPCTACPPHRVSWTALGCRTKCVPACPPCGDGTISLACNPCPCSQVYGHCACCESRCLLCKLKARIRGCFHRDDCGCCGTCDGCVVIGAPVAQPVKGPEPIRAPEPKKMPVAPKDEPVKQTSAKDVAPKELPSFEIRREYLPRVGHNDDYSRVTGQLYYVHAAGGLWVVRYAPHDVEDRFGGSVVLAEAVSLSHLRDGDLVTVHGEVLNEGRATKYLGGPLYRPVAVTLVQRLDP